MLTSRAFIFVYRGKVGGRIRWFTVGEKPIGFGASSEKSKFQTLIRLYMNFYEFVTSLTVWIGLSSQADGSLHQWD